MDEIDVDDYMFECAVCIEQINDTWRMLPCQHPFCLACLKKLFTIHEQPLCPTCRKMVTIPIDDLGRPDLLLTLFEKLKLEATKERETENVSGAIEQSVDDDCAKREIDQDRQHLEIALCTSADQAVLEAEEETWTEADLTAVIHQLSIEHDEPEACSSGNNSVMENYPGTQDDVCSSAGVQRVSANPEISVNELDMTSQPPESIIGKSELGCAYVPCIFGSLNFVQYLKKHCERTVLDAIMTVNVNQDKMNSMKKREIKEYLEVIDDYLHALECYRRDQINKILEDSAGNRDNVERILVIEDWDNSNDDRRGTGIGNEDDDLNSAVELSRQTYLQRDEEALLDITLKKSEILDPIHSARLQLLDARDKLEFRLVIIESEEYY